MNQRQLSYFITVLECGSIKIAADQLKLSPQGLSKTILLLEEELGNQLFTRTKNGLVPTVYALKLKPHALNILREYSSINTDVAQYAQKEIFNVVAAYGTIYLLGTDFVRKFYEQNPTVQLNLTEMTDYPAIEKLASNKVELGILPAPLDTTLFYGERLITSRHCLIINKANPLSEKKVIDYKDLNGVPLALKGREYVMYTGNINRFLSIGTNPVIYMETSSDALIADLAEQNLAVGVSLDYLAKLHARPNTVIRPFADATCSRTLYIAQPINTILSDTAEAFKKLILEYFKTLDGTSGEAE